MDNAQRDWQAIKSIRLIGWVIIIFSVLMAALFFYIALTVRPVDAFGNRNNLAIGFNFVLALVTLFAGLLIGAVCNVLASIAESLLTIRWNTPLLYEETDGPASTVRRVSRR